MTQDERRSVERFRGRLGLLFLLKYTLTSLTVWAFLFGTTALALRGSLGLSRLDLLWGLLSLPLALAPAAWLAWRRLPSSEKVRALLDRHGRCGGLLMTADEQPLGEWALPQVRTPALRWRAGRPSALLAAGLTFLAFAFAVPESFAQFGPDPLDVAREVKKLEEQIAVLDKDKHIEKQRAAEMLSKLEQVQRDAKGRDPIKTLESLDHLNDVTRQTAREAAGKALRHMEELGRMEEFARRAERASGKMDKAKLTEMMHELAAMTKRLENERELLESGLDKETLDAIKKSTLTPEQAKKLMEALKEAKEKTKEMGKRLVEAKLLKPEDLEKLEKAGKVDAEALIEFLKENGAKSDLTKALEDEDGSGGTENSEEKQPGGKLNFGDESSADGTKFKEEELPPAKLQALKESRLDGISAGTPNVGREKAVKGASGALDGSKVGGGSASTQVVLPRHRGAVERYFDRPAMPKK